jgi:ubiquinone/menaquinone biosynthesis C-methylase UbiE
VALIRQADVQKLCFADKSFDAVLSCETTEHVPDPQNAVREIHRVTRARSCASAASRWRGHIYFLVAVRKVWDS